jgi:flagellar M-ring protein FliF
LQNVMSVWSGLDARRRVIIILAVVTVFASVLLLSRMASSPSMSLLYAGLEPNAAGEVVSSLEAQGQSYEVRGSSIYVPSNRRDELRLTLASSGLPANGGAGYELLDSLTGFGTTSQMFYAAYWRAKEGELARTIVASPFVRSARVHISNQTGQPFLRNQQISGSVFVTPTNDPISQSQARALTFLVASAVTGLSTGSVSVIDAVSGTMIASDDTSSGIEGSGDREAQIKQSVERLLEAYVGPGGAVVEVNLETETSSESITERRFDPESRVAISTDTEERTESSQGNGANDVTVASNLPDGDAAGGGQNSSSQNSESRERVNFEVSETQREIVRAPGAVKRLSVAVLVDGVETTDATGASQWQPRSEEQLSSLRELVSSAVGLNEERGDSLTLKSMQFETIASPEGTFAEASFLDKFPIDVNMVIQMVVLAVVAIAIGLFVIRPILTSPTRQTAGSLPVAGPEGAPLGIPLEQPEADSLAAVLPSELASLNSVASLDDFDFSLGDDAAVGDLPALSTQSDDPVTRLRQMIEDRQDETVEVLRGWIEETKEPVG